VDPLGLKQVDRSLTSSVLIDVEGVPLKTTVRLMLKQLELAYIVEDGKLLISSSMRIQERAGRPGGNSKGESDERK
jgi:hypothetical protein